MSSQILSSYIIKLNHPLKEIRERALKLLIAKLELGWKLEDELSSTRELLEALLSWFHVQQEPSLQREVIQLLHNTIKTKAGTYICKEFGVKTILSTLNKIKDKLDVNAMEIYEDVIETLCFLNTVESEENVTVPRLNLHSTSSSERDNGSSSGYYNLGPNSCASSNETSISNEGIEIGASDLTNSSEGIRVLLLPWVELCPSDSKTIILIEDALRLLKSTRRCCRFIRDVFLRDFPAEIFLNRPGIIKNLLSICEGVKGGRPGESLQVLLHITRALCKRILQLSSLDLVHETNKISVDYKELNDEVNLELENIAREDGLHVPRQEDGLAALRQLPAPIYALDTLQSILSIMARSVVLLDPVDKTEVLDLKELNTCLSLVDCLIKLLLKCVSDIFWRVDHNSKTLRDVAHKSCMVMRLLGDLLMKYNKSFIEDTSRTHHRVAWLRLVGCAVTLLSWAQESAMPPSSLVAALQVAHLDPAIQLFYPEISRKLAMVLENSKTSIDKEYKSKYRELTKLFASMEECVEFMKNKNSCRNSKAILNRIKKSLPTLELHLSESYLVDVADILLNKIKDYNLNDNDWSTARRIALKLMAHNLDWVRGKFYSMMSEMVKSVVIGDDANQTDNENLLMLLCDVEIFTEICCHGLSSNIKEVENSASDIILCLLRGRLVLSEGCWWRLLASMLPILPLLHVYAAHDTQLGQAIWKSLDSEIVECMGVPLADAVWGRARLLFVRCVAIQLEAAHLICNLLADDKYLPPKESLRADVLLNALRRIEPQDFNVDTTSSSSESNQTTGLLQILDVLKQDIILDEDGALVVRQSASPALEPALRRATLQQLAVMLRHRDLHDTFLQYDGLDLIVAILRMSLLVDDYLAYPECAISCVSILNSVCFASRHSLIKIPDLASLLIRVIVVFPANESAVVMSTQVLSLTAWAGFALLEPRVRGARLALPAAVLERTTLPFPANVYWQSSPNTDHSTVEWVLSDEPWVACVRVRWWCSHSGGAWAVRGAGQAPDAALSPLWLRPTAGDVACLRAACPLRAASASLLQLENATSHRHVVDALTILESYMSLLPSSNTDAADVSALPWQHTRRYLASPPASSRDTSLLVALMQFILVYMDNVPTDGATTSWIKSYFIGSDSIVISLLSRDQLHPQQTDQETIEVVQLHIHIVKVILRCVVLLEYDEYDSNKLESLLKILLACLEKIDLKNFHMLGYLNELMRCIRYVLHSRYCKLSEDTMLVCLKLVTKILTGCATGAGCKGQACRLDALLGLLAIMRQMHEQHIPVQRWCDYWSGDVVRAIVDCGRAACAYVRAASLRLITAVIHHAQLLPQILQAIPEESLSHHACRIFSQRHEANVVRVAAASLLAAYASRASPHTEILELEVLQQLKENNFLENCLQILIDFCNEKEYKSNLELNIPLSILERRSELEVRAQKCSDLRIEPANVARQPPPTVELVAAVADVVHNTTVFNRCPVRMWNERGIYRLLFRCASWSGAADASVSQLRAASCRALATAAAHKCVRDTLAATKDCLYNLLVTLTPLEKDEFKTDSIQARSKALLLLGSVLTDRTASDTVWHELRDRRSVSFFSLLLQSLRSDDIEFQAAGLYCLSELTQSAIENNHPGSSQDESWIEFFDNIKSPFILVPLSGSGAGDGAINECRPEYMAEELCKSVIDVFQKSSLDMKMPQSSQNEAWVCACSCLSRLLAASPRSRRLGLHRRLPRALTAALAALRDHLSVSGKPADVIRNADHNPVLRTLYWILTVIDCQMVNYAPAKEAFVEDNIPVSLCRLWPWCMMTERLRYTTVHLLYTFVNDCAKAWSAMCVCVCGRSVAGELCALATREAARGARGPRNAPRAAHPPDTLLLLCVATLRRCLPHHQCRSILIKSEVLASLYKVAERERVLGGGGARRAWARLGEAAARHPDGAGTLLALVAGRARAPPAPATRAPLVRALANAASHHRNVFLQSPDLLELLSSTLLAGNTEEVVSAARAVWALAANNHKAKLQLRNAGVAAAVHTASQRLQRDGGPHTQRALQLVTYTDTLLRAA